MFIRVTPCVCQVHFPSIGLHVGKGIEHMCELVGREVLRIVVPPINSPAVSLARLYACNILGGLAS